MVVALKASDIKVLFSAKDIDNALNVAAKQISRDCHDIENLVVVGVLKGAIHVTSDLVRKLNIPCQLEFIRLSSYSGIKNTGNVRLYDLSLPALEERNILVIEDIVDSGRTAKFLINFFKNQAKVKSIKIFSLINKPSKRIPELADLNPDYSCFTVDDKFILGYGLDYEQKFRELPYIGFMEGLCIRVQ